jgi:hypothetical protein
LVQSTDVSEERFASIFRVEETRNQEDAGDKLKPVGACFYPEDGSSTFLQNVDEILPDYTALYPRI